MHPCIVKLNGWPDSFGERIEALARHVDELSVIRPTPSNCESPIDRIENVSVYEISPARPEAITTTWKHLVIFPLYALQTIIILTYLLKFSDNRPSVIHSTDYTVSAVPVTAIGSLLGVPTVVSVRGLIEPRYENQIIEADSVVGQINLKILRRLPSFVFGRANHIITKAAYQVDYVQHNYQPDVKFSVIPTGVDFSVFDPEGVASADRRIFERLNLPIDRSNRTIVHLGKLSEDKGVDKLFSLVEAVDSELPANVKVLCVGRTRSEEFERRIRERADALSRVYVHPEQIPFEAVPHLIYEATAMVLLSEANHEGTPRVLQESCAMGTPIIASDVTGIRGAFTELQGAFLIDRDDPDAFRDAIINIIENPIDEDREAVRRRFDIDQNYGRYRDAYETAIHRYRESER